jgi:hypothetical protein
MFADDIKLYNDTDNSFTLQEGLNKVLSWSKSWGLPLNKNKCVVLHISKKILVLLGTKYFGRHSSVTSKQINVNQALTSSQ